MSTHRIHKSAAKSNSGESSSSCDEQRYVAIDPLHQRSITTEPSDSSNEEISEDDKEWNPHEPDVLQNMSEREQQRQKIIYGESSALRLAATEVSTEIFLPAEIYTTERNHVRTLKVLDQVFKRPMGQLGQPYESLVDQMFPAAFPKLKSLHSYFASVLKRRVRSDSNVVTEIGDLLSEWVSFGYILAPWAFFLQCFASLITV